MRNGYRKKKEENNFIFQYIQKICKYYKYIIKYKKEDEVCTH